MIVQPTIIPAILIPSSFHMSGALLAGYDYCKVYCDKATNILGGHAFSMTNASGGNGVIEIRDAAAGGGNAITITVTSGTNEAVGTGSLSIAAAGYFYIRCATANALNNVNVDVW